MKGTFVTILEKDLKSEISKILDKELNFKIYREKERNHQVYFIELDFGFLNLDGIKLVLQKLTLSDHEIEDLTFDCEDRNLSKITIHLSYATDLLKNILNIQENVVFDENVFVDYTDENEILIYFLCIKKENL